MTDAYEVYQEVLSKVNKEENGYLPADLFNTYAREADRYVFNDYVARLQNPQSAAAEKQKIEDRLAPFDVQAIQPATGGIFLIPDDAAYFRSARIKDDGGASVVKLYALNAILCEADEDPTINVADIKRQIDDLANNNSMVGVDLLDHDQLGKRLTSYVPGKKPSLKKPVMERVTVNGKRGFQVYPAESLSVFFNYYRRPAYPKLVMTPNRITKELVYDLSKSTGFEWEEEAMGDVVTKIETSFATYIREGGLFQMAAAEQKP